MDRVLLTKTDQTLDYSYTVVIGNSITDVQFSYYGEETNKSSQEDHQRKVYRWFNEFNSLMTSVPPQKIQLKWVAEEREYNWLIDLTAAMFPLSRYSKTDE